MHYKILIVASDYYKDISKNLINHAKYIFNEKSSTSLTYNIDIKKVIGSF